MGGYRPGTPLTTCKVRSSRPFVNWIGLCLIYLFNFFLITNSFYTPWIKYKDFQIIPLPRLPRIRKNHEFSGNIGKT